MKQGQKPRVGAIALSEPSAPPKTAPTVRGRWSVL